MLVKISKNLNMSELDGHSYSRVQRHLIFPTILQLANFEVHLTSSSVAMNALMIFALAMTVVCYR